METWCTVASWLVNSIPEWAVHIWALTGGIVLCSWARHFTLTVPLSTQVHKWVPVNCWGNLTYCGGVACDGLASRPVEAEILLTASWYRNRDKPRQLWASLGSKASLRWTEESIRLEWFLSSSFCGFVFSGYCNVHCYNLFMELQW